MPNHILAYRASIPSEVGQGEDHYHILFNPKTGTCVAYATSDADRAANRTGALYTDKRPAEWLAEPLAKIQAGAGERIAAGGVEWERTYPNISSRDIESIANNYFQAVAWKERAEADIKRAQQARSAATGRANEIASGLESLL